MKRTIALCTLMLAALLQSESAVGAVDFVVEAIPAAVHANLAADDFYVIGPNGKEKPSVFSTMPNVAIAFDVEMPSGYVDLRGGAGLLLNANIYSYMLFGTVGWLQEVKPSILFGPHIGLSYFPSPEWWGETDVTFSDTTGWLAGLYFSAGDKISYVLSVDYLSMIFDVEEVAPGVITSADEIDMSGVAVQFGIRVQF